MLYTIENEFLSLTVTTAGGSMKSLRYLPTGEERLWQGDKFWTSQDVVIFPILGHAGKFVAKGEEFTLRSHGVARYAEFSLADKDDEKITLSFSSDDGTMKEYPYTFEFSITYRLRGNAVEITYFVRGTEGVIPFYVGGHPGMKAPGGEAIIEFENLENPIMYPVGSDEAVPMEGLCRFVANKEFFKECQTFQLGSLSGGAIYADTADGYRYTYRSDCPVFAFWSNPDGGEYVCVEPWWGTNDYPAAPREITLKPFMNFADEKGKSFTYSLSVDKI
ncbi:MAG: hypothetical protein LUD29_06090 [Clostridia bacterium]|nr:hypothetical protein [Clostridia bacterium]